MFGSLEERLVFSRGQSLTIILMVYLCSIISIFCSSLIVYVSMGRMKKRTKFPLQQRLLFLLGTLDVIFLVGMVLSFFLTPRGQTITSFGTIQSCTAQGAIATFGTQGTQLCNMFLAFYYYLTVKHGKTNKELKCWEYVWFSIILGYPLLLVSTALFQNNFGVWEGADGCFLAGTYPMSCDIQPEIECQRGDSEYRFVLWLFSIVSFVLASLGCFAFTIMVWFAYRKLIRQSSRYIFDGSASTQNYLAREVTKQTILYSAVYFNMIFWMGTVQFINPFVFASGAPLFIKFILHLISKMFIVLTGVFNCAAYMRPSYNSWKRAYPNLSSWEAFKSAVENESPPRSSTTVQNKKPRRYSTDNPRDPSHSSIGFRINDATPTSALNLNVTDDT